MAEIIKISELPSQTVFADDDLFATVDTSIAETKKAQLSNIKTYMQGDLNTRLTTAESDINNVDTRLTTAEGEIDTAQTDINNAESVIGNETDTYSASSTYALGSLVIYNSLLYKCTTAITVAEAWTIAHWTQVSLTSLAQSGDVYSTTERKTNKIWIDNKPIYRKIISVGANTTVSHGVSNIGTVTCMDGIFKDGNFYKKTPYFIANESTTFATTLYADTTNLYIPNGSSVDISERVYFYVILEYTKTTD